MLKNTQNNILELLKRIIDFVLPPRTNFEIVRNLDKNTIFSLPKSDSVQNERWICPIFQYQDNRVKAIIWELKYKENTMPLETIGKMMFEEIISVVSDIVLFNNNAEFILLPIPMTEKAKVERGYNQSELIAKSIIENDSQRILLYAPQWFRKIKETEKQSRSNTKEERMSNLKDCFEANPNVEGKYVFLIDDVVTTGSTLIEARKTLINMGAIDVFAFTIAH